MHLISHYLNLIIPFCGLMSYSLVYLTLFIGWGLFLVKKPVNWITFLSLPYVGTAIFASVAYLMLYLPFSPQMILKIIFSLLVFASATGWILFGKNIFKAFRLLIQKNKLTLLCLAVMNLFLCLIFFNFIYQNGLHDEYFHHAVINLFILNDQYPLLDPYAKAGTINSYYHIGLFFPVIIFQSIFKTSIEMTLDIIKVALLLPVVPLVGLMLKKLFKSNNLVQMSMIVFCVLLSGPSFFLTDTFSQHILLNRPGPLIYVPILYELAGITWFGLVFYLIFILLWLYIISSKHLLNEPGKIFFLVITIFSLKIINQAFFLVYISNILFLGFYNLIEQRTISRRNIVYLLLGGSFLVLLLSSYTFKSYLLNSSGTVNTFSTFIRPIHDWGIPYSVENPNDEIKVLTKFANINQGDTFAQLGIFPSLILLVLLATILLKRSTTPFTSLMLFNLALFPIIVYIAKFGDSNLGLNKFLKVGYVWAPIAMIYLFTKYSINPYFRLSLWIILIFSIITPVIYFTRTDNQNIQQYWLVNDSQDQQLINYLNTQPTLKEVVTNATSIQYFIANTSNTQIYTCSNICQVDDHRELVLVDHSLPPGHLLDNQNKLIEVFNNSKYTIYTLK